MTEVTAEELSKKQYEATSEKVKLMGKLASMMSMLFAFCSVACLPRTFFDPGGKCLMTVTPFMVYQG